MKHLYLLALLTFSTAKSQNDTIWVDTSNNKTTKENANSYYTISVKDTLKTPALYIVRKYQKNHSLLTEGTSHNTNPDYIIYHGELKNYDTNGNLFNIYNYRFGELQGTTYSFPYQKSYEFEYRNNKPFNGILYQLTNLTYIRYEYDKGDLTSFTYYLSEKEYLKSLLKDEIFQSTEYYRNDTLIHTLTYKEGRPYNGYLYEINTETALIESRKNYNEGKLSEDIYYYKTGDIKYKSILKEDGASGEGLFYNKEHQIIATLKYNIKEGKTEILEGKEILFNTTTGKEDVISFIVDYKNGNITTLTAFKDNGDMEYIQHMSNGQLLKTDFYKNNTYGSTLIYDEKSLPFNGVLYKNEFEITYTEGKVTKMVSYYESGEIFSVFENGLKTFYQRDGHTLGKLEYIYKKTENDYFPYNGTHFEKTNDLITSLEVIKNGNLLQNIHYTYKDTKQIKRHEDIYQENNIREIFQYYENGNIKSEEYYNANHLKSAIYYKEDGTYLGKFENSGIPQGDYYEFFPLDDHIKRHSVYKNGKHLLIKEYLQDPLTKKMTLKVEMEYNGKAIYYDNEQIIAEATIVNGKPKDGLILKEYPQIQTNIFTNYENFLKNDEELIYNSTTQELLKRKFYFQGVLQFSEYYSNNILAASTFSTNGIFSEEASIYNKEGAITSTLKLENNKVKEGVLESFYNDFKYKIIYSKNTIILKEIYKGDVLVYKEELQKDKTIKVNTYYENGANHYQYYHKNALLDGELLQWNVFSNLELKAHFKSGIMKNGSATFYPIVSKVSNGYEKIYTNEKDFFLELYNENDVLIRKQPLSKHEIKNVLFYINNLYPPVDPEISNIRIIDFNKF